jgi:hypothetical protein
LVCCTKKYLATLVLTHSCRVTTGHPLCLHQRAECLAADMAPNFDFDRKKF